MSRVNGRQLRRRYVQRLERARREFANDAHAPAGYRDGFCAGLEFAQTVLRKG